MDKLIAALNKGGVSARWLGASPPDGACLIPLGERGTLVLDDPSDVPRAVAALASALTLENEEEPTRVSAMRRILRGAYDANDPLCHAIGLREEAPRCVLAFQSRDDMAPLKRALEELFPPDGEDIAVETGAGRMAVSKVVDAMQEEDLAELCQAIQDTVQSDAGMRVVAGIGGPREGLDDLADSYNEALSAIRVGSRFHPERDVFVYRTLIIERFLQEVPARTLRDYHARLFGPHNEKVLGDEMLLTIERFFACNLNLSEAARQLFIHRNTLVYRLDKLEKAVGLDLRKFDDAAIYKLLNMMGS